MTSAATARADRLESLTLVTGLTLCAVSLTMIVLLMRPASSTDLLAVLTQLDPWGESLLLPLGMITALMSLAALLRLWNLGSRRGRFRLLSILLLFALFILELTTIEPVVRRLLAATDPLAATVTADVSHLRFLNLVRAVTLVGAAFALIAAHRAPYPIEESTDGFTVRHRTLLLMLGTATMFEGYDRFIASLALPYIGKDLGADEGALGYALAAIRLGALVAILFGRLADRYGRRRLLIMSVAAYTLATAATGFSTGLIDFALFQLVATIFLTTELALAQVIIAEEFPPRMRGLGQGMLGAFGAFGAGLAAMLFPILQRTEFGWRGMYLIGVLPLFLIVLLQRHLPETTRWQQTRSEVIARGRDLLAGRWRTPFLVLTLLSAVASAAAAPAFSFASYRATTAMQWSPGQVSAMILGGGSMGFIGYFLLGRLSDGVGRRWIGALGILGGAVAIALFYQTHYLLPAFALLTFSESGVLIAINALGTELFPTDLRATAKAWLTNAATIGALVGLAAVGVLSTVEGGHATIIAILAAVLFLHAPLFFLLRETSHAELEEIGPA
jgi:putative MFS transporter